MKINLETLNYLFFEYVQKFEFEGKPKGQISYMGLRSEKLNGKQRYCLSKCLKHSELVTYQKLIKLLKTALDENKPIELNQTRL